ncbi:protein of unknown function [Agrobacterium pusense]|uniref:Uncharacterized protein n=1 Tax=Agrobacterium pusense TaxID=648995 RepID=U4PXR6_9HYPH|nr:protein of unknown function [Agrobacterium pusense]
MVNTHLWNPMPNFESDVENLPNPEGIGATSRYQAKKRLTGRCSPR